MKKTLIGLMALALVGFVAGTGFAATDSTDVTVEVTEIDQLDASTSVYLTLSTPTEGGAYTQGVMSDVQGLKYSHNSSTSKKITATALKNDTNATNDITLKVKANDGDEIETLVNNGTDVEGGAVVWTGIGAGVYTEGLYWTADGTLANTKAGDYIWTVTFTSADAT